MFARIGLLVTHRARRILVLAGLALVAAAVLGIHAPGELKSSGFTSPSAPSQLVSDKLEHTFGGAPNLVFLVQARTGTVDAPAVVAAGQQLATGLARSHGVTSVSSYWSTRAPSLRSTNGRQALVVADVAGNDKTVRDRSKALIRQFSVEAKAPVR